jgi:acyl-coenzyme A synthetase/AMP-(fatty) acid ligase
MGLDINEDESNNTARTLEKMRASLPNYMLPDRLIVLRDLPLSTNGKIDYLTLEAYAEMR